MHVILALAGVAAAATPVLHAGDPAAAVEAVSASVGVPPWELRPVSTAELFPGLGAAVVGAGQPAGCTSGATVNGAVRELVESAAKWEFKQEWGTMRSNLAKADQTLPCLGEPAEASLMARLYSLDGYAAAEIGDTAAATAAFRRARSSQPDLAWTGPSDSPAAAVFASVVATAPATGKLALGPGFKDQSTLWVDGRLMNVDHGVLTLPEGVHLVQVLQPKPSTWVVAIRPGQPVALVSRPDARDHALDGAMDEAGRLVIEAAVGHGPGAEAVWVWTGGALWRVTQSWEATQVRPRAAPKPPAQYGTSRLLTGLGLGLTVAGGAGAVYGWTETARLKDDPGDSDDAYAYRSAWYDTSQNVAVVSSIVGGVGVASLVAGIVMGLPERSAGAQIAAVPTEGGGVVVLAGGF